MSSVVGKLYGLVPTGAGVPPSADQAICDRVYEGSPALEQRADPERKGIAIIIELDKVSGLFARTRYNMVKNVD